MKKYFVFSDVHGFYDILMKSLDDAGFDINNENHIIISCGDLLDRGDKPMQCLRFVNSIPEKRKILIRGNHEDLIEECIKRKRFLSHDMSNGTMGTILNIGGYVADKEHVFEIAKRDQDLNKYLHSVIDYYELDDKVFVHGWIPPDDDWRSGNWSKARWENGMEEWDCGLRVDGKTIYCGHWHTSWGHKYLHNVGVEFNNPYSTNPEHRNGAHFEPFIDDGICAIDACTALSHKINVVTFVKE